MASLLLAVEMGTIVDIVVAVLMLLFVIIGAKRGFLKSLIKVFGTILSLLFAALFCGAFAKFLENSFSFVTTVGDKLGGVLSKIFGEEFMNTSISSATEQFLADNNIPAWLINVILPAIQSLGANSDATLAQIVCPVFGYYIALILSFIILFILFKLVFFLLSKIVSGLRKIAIVGIADSLLGAVFGIIEAIITISLIIMVIKVVPLSFLQDVVIAIEESAIANFINKLNIFELIINVISKININQYLQQIISSVV